MSGIDRSAWLKAVEDVNNAPLANDPNILTSTEFAEILGKGRCAARRQLEVLIKAGKAQPAKKWIRKPNGLGVMLVPAYRLLAPKAGTNVPRSSTKAPKANKRRG